MTRVVCRPVDPVVGDLPGNRERTVAAVRAAAARGADVIVLPELATSGYVFASAAEAGSTAVTPADPVFAGWADAAGGAVVVGGFCERGPDGRLYNSAAVVDRGEVRAVYRKTHLWDAERLVFTPGDRPAPVVRTSAGPIGVLICYDLEFPEMPRALARAGARLIAAPVNWPLVDRPAGERPPEVVIAMAAARVNRVFIACCDRRGEERGVTWTDGSTIIDAHGWPRAAAPGGRTGRAAASGGFADSESAGGLEGAAASERTAASEAADGFDGVVADVVPADAADKTVSPRNDLLGDRRPELY